jgi:rhodanese-related sulfurtransferase
MARLVLFVPLLLCATAVRAHDIQDATLGEAAEKAKEVSTAEMRSILERKSAVVFDSRPVREFAVGHIPGALNVSAKPGVLISVYVSDAKEIERIVHGDKSTPIVLYCNGPFCQKSKRLSAELLEAGFTNVRRYQLGMPVWRALGGVQQIELEGLRYVLEKDGTAVLLDARGTSDLPKAKGLLAADVKKAKDDGRLPMEDHNTRILIVGADAAQARGLAEAVVRESFNNVAFFAGAANALEGVAGAVPSATK